MIGGILIPFRTIDAYGTWWDESSDLMLDMFRRKELFVVHNLDANRVGSAGHLRNDSFESREEGLYAVAECDESELGDFALALAGSGRAAWSSGAWPGQNTVQVRADGYVERWALVEGSVCHETIVASPRGTTAIEIRSINGKQEEVSRGRWIMPTEIENEINEDELTVIDDPVREPLTELQQADVIRIADEIQTRLAQQATPPMRSLAPNQRPREPHQPQIHVRSVYDDVSLFGLCILHEMRRKQSVNVQNKFYQADETFMRAIVDKMERMNKEERRVEDARLLHPEANIRSLPFNAVDSVAQDTWRKYLPNLRADEAMQSTLATAGDELVPTLMSSVAWFNFRLASRVFGLFSAFQMPSNPFDYPAVTASPTPEKVSELADQASMSFANSIYPAGKLTTSKITFNAGEMGVICLASRVIFEDAGVMLADIMAKQVTDDFVENVDDVLVNADETTGATNISYYGAAIPSTHRYLILDGLRHSAHVDDSGNDSAANATIEVGDPAVLAQLMGTDGIIGTDVQQQAMLVDPGSYYKIAALSDLQTMDKIGDKAVLLTGQVGAWAGRPLIVTSAMKKVNSSGYIHSSTGNTTGNQLLVHRGGILIGLRRALESQIIQTVDAAALALLMTIRLDMQVMQQGHVAYGYNSTI